MTTRRPQMGDTNWPDWPDWNQHPVTTAPAAPRGLSPGRMSLRRQRDFMSYKRGTGATDRKP